KRNVDGRATWHSCRWRRLNERLVVVENPFAQRMRREKVRIDVQRRGDFVQRTLTIAGVRRRACGGQSCLKSLPSLTCIHDQRISKMSSGWALGRAWPTDELSGRFLSRYHAMRPSD